MDALDAQRVLLEAQLAQINPTSQVFSDTGQRVMGPEDRLKALKSQLASYKARFAPDHPDIVSTAREIEGLEKTVKTDDETGDRSEAAGRGKGGVGAGAREGFPRSSRTWSACSTRSTGCERAVDARGCGRQTAHSDHALR